MQVSHGGDHWEVPQCASVPLAGSELPTPSLFSEKEDFSGSIWKLFLPLCRQSRERGEHCKQGYIQLGGMEQLAPKRPHSTQ